MNGFKVANGQDVKNKDDFVKLDKLCQQIDVKWVSVSIGAPYWAVLRMHHYQTWMHHNSLLIAEIAIESTV